MSLVQRQLSATFQLEPPLLAPNAKPTFDGTNNTVTVSGLRMSASIAKTGGYDQGTLQLTIWGLPLSIMNALSTLGRAQGQIPRNQVSLLAGNAASTVSLAYYGQVFSSYIEAAGAPDVSMRVTASTSFQAQSIAVPPVSYQGRADAVVILQQLATQGNFAPMINNGVQGVFLTNPYLKGSVMQQIQKVCRDAGIFYSITFDGKLAIWPRGGGLKKAAIVVSAATGMVGYPSPSSNGFLEVQTLYNPDLQYGGLVQLETSFNVAQNMWQICGISHNLDALVPDGQWFTTLTLNVPGIATFGQ